MENDTFSSKRKNDVNVVLLCSIQS